MRFFLACGWWAVLVVAGLPFLAWMAALKAVDEAWAAWQRKQLRHAGRAGR